MIFILLLKNYNLFDKIVGKIHFRLFLMHIINYIKILISFHWFLIFRYIINKIIMVLITIIIRSISLSIYATDKVYWLNKYICIIYTFSSLIYISIALSLFIILYIVIVFFCDKVICQIGFLYYVYFNAMTLSSSKLISL